jgi:hypothetical protein
MVTGRGYILGPGGEIERIKKREKGKKGERNK